jgi:hypothetical protein
VAVRILEEGRGRGCRETSRMRGPEQASNSFYQGLFARRHRIQSRDQVGSPVAYTYLATAAADLDGMNSAELCIGVN